MRALVAHFALTSPPAAGSPATATGGYADGTYTGPVVNAYYGLMQIQAIIKGGRLTSIRVLQYPNDRGPRSSSTGKPCRCCATR